jgi:hypothetical protein
MNKFVLIFAALISGCFSGNSNSSPKDVRNAYQARELTENSTDKRVELILWEITRRAKQGKNYLMEHVNTEADAKFYIEQLTKRGFRVEVTPQYTWIQIMVYW